MGIVQAGPVRPMGVGFDCIRITVQSRASPAARHRHQLHHPEAGGAGPRAQWRLCLAALRVMALYVHFVYIFWVVPR